MSWVDDVVAVYGESKIHGGPVQMRDEGNTRYDKTYWVWFPESRGRLNHNVAFEKRSHWANFETRTTYDVWTIHIRTHDSRKPSIEYNSRTEPTDELMRQLLDLTGFLADATDRAVVL